MNKYLSKLNKMGALKIAFSLLLMLCLLVGFKNFSNNYEFNEILRSMRSPWYLVFVFGLLFLNIYTESRKWRALISFDIESLRSIKAVLVGYSTALITPNRLGEFAGRNTLFAKTFRPALTTATLLGSFIQGSITICFGLGSIFLFPLGADLISQIDYGFIVWLISFGAAIFLAGYFFRRRLSVLLSGYIKSLQEVTSRQFFNAAYWGVIRYLTFLTQFYLALLLFGFDGSFLLAACGISVMYFVQSYIPLTSFGELGLREFLAYLIFSPYMEFGLAAVFPALVIWLVNIATPSLLGLAILKMRLGFAD